jgi:hypothetical protein
MSAAAGGGAVLGYIDDAPGRATAGSVERGSRTAGQMYYLVVDGYDGRSGNYGLNVIPSP